MKKLIIFPVLFLSVITRGTGSEVEIIHRNSDMNIKTETATFGNGCFWCSEAIFERIRGVQNVVSGYSGGAVEHPSYKDVCTGETGHAEVIQITFDASLVSFVELLEIFFKE